MDKDVRPSTIAKTASDTLGLTILHSSGALLGKGWLCRKGMKYIYEGILFNEIGQNADDALLGGYVSDNLSGWQSVYRIAVLIKDSGVRICHKADINSRTSP